MMVALCSVKSLDAVTVRGQSHSQVCCDPLELLNFVSSHLEPMNEMCERAGLSAARVAERTRRVFEYFHLS